jgi:purine catabolism regulator
MFITIKEILALPLFRESKVIAGENSVNRRVQWVVSVYNSHFFSQVKQDYLAVVPNYILNDINIERYLKDETIAGSFSGLLIHGRASPGRKKKLIDFTREYGCPVIEIPDTINFSLIAKTILNEITARQVSFLQYSETLDYQLSKAILHNQGLNKIAKTLADSIGRKVRIFDNEFNIITSASPKDTDSADYYPISAIECQKEVSALAESRLIEKVRGSKIPLKILTMDKNGIPKQLICKIHAEDQEFGYISVLQGEKQFTEFDLITVNHTAAIIGLELLKNKTLIYTVTDTTSRFISEILTAPKTDTNELKEKVHYLGLSMVQKYLLLSIDFYNGKRDFIIAKLKQDLGDMFFPIIGCVDDILVVLFPLNEDYEFKAISERLTKKHKSFIEKGLNISMGVSAQPRKLLDLKESYKEACSALKIGREIFGEGFVVFYDDVRIYDLLLNVSNRELLTELKNRYIKRLVDYDAANLSDLVHTLEVFLHNHLNYTRTSNDLFIHRQTLRYRLQRIKEILDIDFNRYTDVLGMELALMVNNLDKKGGVDRDGKR